MFLAWIPGRPSSLTNYCLCSGLSSAHGNTSGVKLPSWSTHAHILKAPGAPISHRPTQSTPYYCFHFLFSLLCLLRRNLVLPAHPNTAQEAIPQLLWSSASQITPQGGPPNTPARLSSLPSALPLHHPFFLEHPATRHTEFVSRGTFCLSRNVRVTTAGTYQCSSSLLCPQFLE